MRELSLNVLDIVQNSISADATLIEIIVEEDRGKDRLQIEINDNGRGMSPEQVEQVKDPFFTTRTTRKVGLGVPLFQMAAQQTGGDLEIDSEIGKGTKLKVWFVPSSVDMTPLGEMNDTVSILVRCNPQIDFVFRHKLDEKEFTLDTRELKEVLGDDVALDTPDVMDWINGYLQEQTELLHGGNNE